MSAPRMLVVIPARDAADWYRRNLDSLFAQTWTRWRAVYVDDRSTDDTADRVWRHVGERGQRGRVEVVRPETRLWPARARRLACMGADPDEVVCMLDGDDWLAMPTALERVAEAYAAGAEVTFGRYLAWSGEGELSRWPQPDEDFPPEVVAARGYRAHRWISSHLRTARARHLQSIPAADLRDHEGGWLKCCTDIAEMWWALEQSGGRHTRLDEVVYIYNRVNSRRYPTSWYRRETEPDMNRYRETVQRLLRRQGPRLSLCLAASTAELPRLTDSLRALAAVAPGADIERVVAVFGVAGPAAEARVTEAVGADDTRVFVSPVALDAVADPHEVALSLGAGRRLLPLALADRPTAAELGALIAGPPTDDRVIEAPIQRAPGGRPRPAIDRRRLHAERATPDDGPFEGGRHVHPLRRPGAP